MQQQTVTPVENSRPQLSIISVESLIDTMQVGILLFSQQSEILIANQFARHIVDSRNWLWIADKRLRHNGRSHSGLETAIRQATHPGVEIESPVVLRGDKQDILLIGVTSIRTTDNKLAALCILADPAMGIQPAVAPLRAVYSMTDAEINITSLIAQGLDYKEIARERNVTVGTVRSFTKTIFKKLGVDSRAGVVHKVHATMVSMNLLKNGAPCT